MKYIERFLFIIIVFLSLGIFAQAAEVRNIVLIGWDGAQREHIKEMINRDELPTLIALSREGRLIDIDITNGATDTKAGWSQILTGCKAETTGVFNNSRYQPIPMGYSVFERLEKFFGADKIATIAIIGKKGHVDADPPQKIPYERWLKRVQRQKQNTTKKRVQNLQGGRIIEENGKQFVMMPGKPYFNAKEKMDLFINALLDNDVVGERAMKELEILKDRRFFMFVHFAQPDHVGHQFGENSDEYTNGIKSDDEWTGKIIAKLKELGLYDKTLVYVTADHGFDEGKKSHAYAPYVFLGTNDPNIIRDGDRMDITPTILKRFGLDLDKLEPRLDGKPFDEKAERKLAPAEAQKAGKRKKLDNKEAK